MVQLPKYAALKSKYNNKYLRYVQEAFSPVYKFLQYSAEEIISPYTKFELEPAESDPSLVNIRCCYSNKYWVSSPSDHHYIIAGADQKQEDKSKWTCTLFQPVYDEDHQSFRFCHVNLGFNVVLWRVSAPYGKCLRAQWSVPDKDLCDLSTIINFESLISLPKYVAFKCDTGTYLSACLVENLPYLRFVSHNVEDETIWMETSNTKDGSVRIMSNYFGKFWKRGTSDWILADSTDTTPKDSNTLFWPAKVDTNVVALRNLGNDSFIKRYTSGSKTHYLNAATKTIDQYAKLQMRELVVSREINAVKFHISNARIYDQTVFAIATANATNNREVPDTIDLNLSCTETISSTWSSSISMKLMDVKTTIETEFPFIVDGNIDISTKFSEEYKWGQTKTTSKTLGKTCRVTIPPMSTIIVSLIATEGTCEIPFSYKQSDKLTNGKTVAYSMDDGVYHGTNYYNFKYETKTKPLLGGC